MNLVPSKCSRSCELEESKRPCLHRPQWRSFTSHSRVKYITFCIIDTTRHLQEMEHPDWPKLVALCFAVSFKVMRQGKPGFPPYALVAARPTPSLNHVGVRCWKSRSFAASSSRASLASFPSGSRPALTARQQSQTAHKLRGDGRSIFNYRNLTLTVLGLA